MWCYSQSLLPAPWSYCCNDPCRGSLEVEKCRENVQSCHRVDSPRSTWTFSHLITSYPRQPGGEQRHYPSGNACASTQRKVIRFSIFALLTFDCCPLKFYRSSLSALKKKLRINSAASILCPLILSKHGLSLTINWAQIYIKVSINERCSYSLNGKSRMCDKWIGWNGGS